MDKMTNFESKLFSSFNIGGIKPERITLSYRDNFRIINDRLKDLLGERADWKLNLDKYYSSEEYLSSCRIVSNVDDIPELSLNDIQKMISADEQYKNKANRLLSLDKIISNNSVSNEKYLEAIYEATAIIGLFEGDTCPLFDWISDRKGIKLSDLPLIINNDPRIRTYPILSIIINSISSLFVAGILYSFTALDTIMSQPKTKYYYRGENAFYNSSKAGYFRNIRVNQNISHLSDFINILRLDEAGSLLDSFDAIKYWNNCSVNYMALFQHYGLKTKMIDITSNIMTALFFACCTFENGKWRPLQKEEFQDYDSRKNVSMIGGDSRYAIIYRSLTEINDMQRALCDEDPFDRYIAPVGYQPFMRCATQYAYMLYSNDELDLYKDTSFEKYKIRLTEEFCQWVFEQSHQGNDIYPKNDIADIQKYFEKINNTKSFSKPLFDKLCSDWKLSKSAIKSIKAQLKMHRYRIQNKTYIIRKEELDRINQSYPIEKAYELCGIEPCAKPIVVIS